MSEKRKILEKNIDNYLKSFRTYNPGSIWVLDLAGNFVHFNDASEQLTGYTQEELGNLSFSKIVHPKDQQRAKEFFEHSFNGKVENFDCTVVNRSGQNSELNVTNIPIFLDDEIIGIYSVINDVTELKRKREIDLMEREKIEKEQTYSEKKFRSVFESANDAIILTNGEMKIISWNKAAERLFGYKESEVLGESFEFIIPNRYRESHQRGVERYLKTNESNVMGKTVELFGLNQEGFEFPLELTLNTWRNGTELFFSAIIRDITERQKAQELYLNSEKLSIAGQLAAGIAHEIRNPLTAIKGFLQLLKAESSNQIYFNIISSEMERIETILSELLVLAKPQASKFERQDLKIILSDVVTLFESQGNLKNIQIIKKFVANKTIIDCDKNQIKQVFINFVKNSMEAMSTGGKITAHISNEGDHSVVIRIIDEGCGIPSELLERLGEPFYSTKDKGTGLGIMVSNKIIKDHMGEMNITSVVNKGTTIEVTFPLSKIK